MKHTKNFGKNNFGPLKSLKLRTPLPPEIHYVWASSCILKAKDAANIKKLRGQESLGGVVSDGRFWQNALCL